MGQAKQRGTKEERIAQAQARGPAKSSAPKSSARAYSPAEYAMANMAVGSLFENLTTPVSIDANVTEFAKMLSDQEPLALTCEPEPWSKQGCCDMNVEKYIEQHGGKMLSGYRLWYNAPDYIEGERHAVWTDGTVVRDVSFCDSGETSIVFVPDERGFEDAPGKVRHTFVKSRQAALAKFHEIEQSMIVQMPAEKAWNTMPSYEQWQAGARSSNSFFGISA